jgi:hypothetical protein
MPTYGRGKIAFVGSLTSNPGPSMTARGIFAPPKRVLAAEIRRQAVAKRMLDKFLPSADYDG